jgi:hypothetical protein
MMQISIDPIKWEELYNKGYSLDMVYLLKMVEDEYDSIYTHPKILALQQTIERKGLISSEGLTEEGKNLLSFVSSNEEIPKLTKKKRTPKHIAPDEDFIKWWKNFPASDTFEYKDKKFKGTRALRVKKEECKVKLDKILLSGEYTIDDMVAALKLEISQKAENSVKTGINKMSYFQNSMTYLNQNTYEAYIELVKAGHKPEEENKQKTYGGVSI